MHSVAVEQAYNYAPPVKGAVISLEIDTTARSYDLNVLDLGGFLPDSANSTSKKVVLTLQADGADVYFVFSNDNTATLSETAKVAAAGTLAFANTYCAKLPSGVTTDAIRIDRRDHRYLHVKGGAAGILRFFASSEAAT